MKLIECSGHVREVAGKKGVSSSSEPEEQTVSRRNLAWAGFQGREDEGRMDVKGSD
jgi:hypothetical protein